MASIGISEFTFGYAFLQEQTHANWANLRAAPILPSLLQEQHEGWDAHLPLAATDFYYQFKLSDYLSQSNAKYIADGTYATAYYRFAFHRKNNNLQHRRLRVHSRHYPNTFYVAPQFNNITAFNVAFLNRQITAQSRLIPVASCRDRRDAAQHYITFREGNRRWNEHSEAVGHHKSFTGEDLRQLYSDTRESWKPVNKDFALELFKKTVRILRKELEPGSPRTAKADIPLFELDPDRATTRDILLRTAEILSVYVGVTLVLVGSSE
jgi:hypothetical protein